MFKERYPQYFETKGEINNIEDEIAEGLEEEKDEN